MLLPNNNCFIISVSNPLNYTLCVLVSSDPHNILSAMQQNCAEEFTLHEGVENYCVSGQEIVYHRRILESY